MHFPQHKRPLYIGVLLGPALLAAVLLVWLQIANLGAFLILYLFALTGAAIFGLPILVYLRKHQILTWASVLCTAIIAGNIYFPILAFFLGDGYSFLYSALASIYGLLVGIGVCIGSWPNNFVRSIL